MTTLASARSTTHIHSFIYILILTSALFLYIASFTRTAGHSIDDGIHIVTAKALATGQGMRLISDPGNPPSTQFPPGLSLLLAPILLIFPEPPGYVIPMKMVSALSALLYAAVSWFWFRRHVSPAIALFLTALVAFNPETVRFSGAVIAEMGYAGVSIAALYYFERYAHTPTRRNLALAVAMMTAAYLFRSVGLSLILAILGVLAMRRQWKTAIITGAGFFMLASPWLLQSTLVGTPEYRDQFWLASLEDPEQGRIGVLGLAERGWYNLKVYVSETLPVHLAPVLGSQRVIEWCREAGLYPMLAAVRLGLAGILLAGFWMRLRRRVSAVEWYAVIYFGTILIWHSRLHWKYMAPVTPVLWLYGVFGIQWLVARLPGRPRISAAVMPLILSLCLTSSVIRSADFLTQGWLFQDTPDPYGAAYGWLKTRTPPDTLLMGFDHLGLYLYTGRKAVAPIMTNHPDQGLQYILSTGVDYCILAQTRVVNEGPTLDSKYIQPVIDQYPEYFLRVYEDSVAQITVYRVRNERIGEWANRRIGA